MAQPSPEEEDIAGVAREVSRRMGVSNFDLKRVSWAGRADRSDECGFVDRKFNFLVLPKALMGRLQPEEWGPLIAVSIIRSKSGGKLARRAGLTRVVLPASLIGLVLVVVAIIFAKEQWTPLVLDVAGLASTVVLTLMYAPEGKKITLLTDRRAAEVVGRENFLQVLQKIDGMGLKDVERLKAGGLRRRFRPSITERIDNLQQSAGSAPI